MPLESHADKPSFWATLPVSPYIHFDERRAERGIPYCVIVDTCSDQLESLGSDELPYSIPTPKTDLGGKYASLGSAYGLAIESGDMARADAINLAQTVIEESNFGENGVEMDLPLDERVIPGPFPAAVPLTADQYAIALMMKVLGASNVTHEDGRVVYRPHQ